MGEFFDIIYNSVSVFAVPGWWWSGIVIALIGGGLIGSKKVQSAGTITGYVIGLIGVVLILMSIRAIPIEFTQFVILICLIVISVLMIIKPRLPVLVRILGVILLLTQRQSR